MAVGAVHAPDAPGWQNQVSRNDLDLFARRADETDVTFVVDLPDDVAVFLAWFDRAVGDIKLIV
jgi:hypothetical protein